MQAGSVCDDMLAPLVAGVRLSGEVRRDVPAFLVHHRYPKTAAHVGDVAAEARRLALRFGVDADAAECAGWLHDTSAVFPTPQRAAIARALGIDVLPEEDSLPMIVHQKLSAVLAADIFGVRDPAVLNAVGCHTTLKAGASPLDLVVFVADKIAWDQAGVPPYTNAIRVALDDSLDAATWVYLDYLWQRRGTLGIVHPWFVAAYRERVGRHHA